MFGKREKNSQPLSYQAFQHMSNLQMKFQGFGLITVGGIYYMNKFPLFSRNPPVPNAQKYGIEKTWAKLLGIETNGIK